MLKAKKRVGVLGVFILLAGIVGVLFYNGIIVIEFNKDNVQNYTVHGVDVSSYQGKIDWQLLASQDISFAFIKATEGSLFTDSKFQYNWEQASQTSLKIGAYHFFSYDSSGATQAENFISAVPVLSSLPPVVDIEFYGEYQKNPLNKGDVFPVLNELLYTLEKQYGVKPILYATQKSYNLYLEEYYSSYPLWIRNTFDKPDLLREQQWTFWQYSDRKKLLGYNGTERFIDMNVFNGNSQEFADWIAANS